MKTAAVICEYNPFHFGHRYQIDTIKRTFGSDCRVIAIMSGCFTQRGEPAIFDKYTRAESALRCGCDLVLELPLPHSMSGADFFARAGVYIASSIGVVDLLFFGSECGELARLQTVAERMSSNEFRQACAEARVTDKGAQTGRLRDEIYRRLWGDEPILSGSNDLLALEYLRALNRFGSAIQPYAVKRVGGEYNSTDMPTGISTGEMSESSFGTNTSLDKRTAPLPRFASATAIRNAILSGSILSDGELMDLLPDKSAELARREIESGRIHSLSKLDKIVSAFIRLRGQDFDNCIEGSASIGARLRKAAAEYSTVDDIVDASVERRYSASRVRRVLLGGMLGIKMSDCDELPAYTNLLGANAVGRELLAEIRKTSRLPVVTRISEIKSLGERARAQLELEKRAAGLYALSCDAPQSPADILRSRPVMV
ncbi:MAG TPA: nucleotidyltransferase family protein [Firmicutes bacterium]|nr:nucleotidyltransferase family protein [Bacillota bacterium]